jgi:glycosyltransferase involved in cell wall biosynthesis
VNKVSVIIPAYGEGRNLPELVESLAKTFEDECEIIVVNDTNVDKSFQIVRNLEEKYKNVKGLFSEVRRGKTRAIIEGFEKSRGDTIVLIDADLQYSPKDIPRLLKTLNDADVVNGLRKFRKDSLRRKAESKIFNLLVRFFFGVKFNDCNSGLKIFKREVLADIVPWLKPGWHRFLLVLAEKKGYKVVEKPVHHYPRAAGISKFDSPLRLFKGFYDLVSLYVFVLKLRRVAS